MKKVIAIIMAALIVCRLFCACSKQQPENEPEHGVSSGMEEESVAADKEEESATRSFTDSLGRTVEIPQELTKIAISGPLAQIVFYSFAPELLVGVSNEWDSTALEYIPDEYKSLPLLGQLYGGKGEMNLEELLASGAEIVVDIGEAKKSAKDDLDALQEQTGIPFVHISASISSMGDAYRKLGELCNLQDRAEEYASYCEKVYKRTSDIVNAVGEENKANTLYCLGDNGCNVIAKGSYHAEVIDMLCNNLAVVDEPSSKGSGNECDFEQIMNWNPDVIFFAPGSIYESVYDSEQWQSINAVKNKKVYEVPNGPYNWMGFPPSVQRYLGMMWMAKNLYPEYADYDLKSEVKEYFKMFYHIELTDEGYAKLVNEQ